MTDYALPSLSVVRSWAVLLACATAGIHGCGSDESGASSSQGGGSAGQAEQRASGTTGVAGASADAPSRGGEAATPLTSGAGPDEDPGAGGTAGSVEVSRAGAGQEARDGEGGSPSSSGGSPETPGSAGQGVGAVAGAWVDTGGGAGIDTACTPTVAVRTRWSFLAGDRVYTPALDADGVLYLPSDDQNLYALDARDGSTLWTFESTAAVYEPVLAADGTLYVPSGNGNLYALDSADGSILWTFPNGVWVGTPAIGSDGTLYLPASDAELLALSPTDGSILWTFNAGYNFKTPVVAADGTVYAASIDDTLYALSPSDGSLLWSYASSGDMFSPAIGPNGTVYAPSYDNHLYALDPDTGSLLWSFTAQGAVTTPVVGSDGTVYVGSTDDNLYALDPADGSVRWSYPTGHNIYLTVAPILAGGTVLISSANVVSALSSEAGTLLWSFSEGGDEGMAVMGADGTLYVPTVLGRLYALLTTPDAVSGLACSPCAISCSYELLAPLDRVVQCLPDGSAFRIVKSCGTGQGCIEGACVECIPEIGRICSGNEVHWIDSCRQTGALIETCGEDRICSGGECKPSATVCDCDCTCTYCTTETTKTCYVANAGCDSCEAVCTEVCSNNRVDCGSYVRSSGSCETTVAE